MIESKMQQISDNNFKNNCRVMNGNYNLSPFNRKINNFHNGNRSLSNSPDLPEKIEKQPTAVIGWTCLNGQAVQKANLSRIQGAIPSKSSVLVLPPFYYGKLKNTKDEFVSPNVQLVSSNCVSKSPVSSTMTSTTQKCRLYPQLCEKLKTSVNCSKKEEMKTVGSYNRLKYSTLLKRKLKDESLNALCCDLNDEECEKDVLLPSARLVSSNRQNDSSVPIQSYQTIFYPTELSDDEDDFTTDSSAIDQLLYHRRTSRILNRTSALRRQMIEQRKSIEQNSEESEKFLNRRLKRLSAAARRSTNCTAKLLQTINNGKFSSKFNSIKSSHRSVDSKRRKNIDKLPKNDRCAFQFGIKCTKDALPFTKHCSQHITYNVNQQLFNFCTARNSNQTSCRAPVFDIVNNQSPVCQKHSLNNQDMASKQLKKIRRKTKPSALTRPQRKKKKKNKLNVKSSNINNNNITNTQNIESTPQIMDIDEALQQASALLEEQDFSFVLNGLKDDLSDFQDIEKSLSLVDNNSTGNK